MPLSHKTIEIERLIKAFETEADRFHDIEFHAYVYRQGKTTVDRKFRTPNHAIMLWQFIGRLETKDDIHKFVKDVNDSNLQWGIRGAELSQLGVIEGPGTNHFVRMAKRAGALFSDEESFAFKARIINEIQSEELKKNPKCKPVTGLNDNPLAIWLNYLLFYLSQTYAGRELSNRIEPDLFTLSLLALEQLASELTIKKSDRSTTDVTKINFRVAVSFPGEKRKYVSRVVNALRSELGPDSVFYDFDYQAQIARPNADVLLQNIYHKQTDLIVVFLCEEYGEKQWCGLEWRSIKDLIKSKQDKRIMLIKFDDADIEGLFSIDGYIDASSFKSREVANFIMQRLELL
ncbi:MAG: TIR domain-containing protein [Imperialibacter sp.]|uniref:TIR domain-containing protein n=1 Tax=Imperialibacter sp. TaxID=2038411 RepID=UPI0032F07E4A